MGSRNPGGTAGAFLEQTDALKASEAWVQAARDFLRATLGLNVKTRGKTCTAIGDEAWGYVLYSEFVFDLPYSLPPALSGVPRAVVEARPIIEDVCEQLQTNPKTRTSPIDPTTTQTGPLLLPR